MLFVDGKHSGTLPLAQPLEGLTPGQHVFASRTKARETSTFVEVRFGRMTDANLDLGAAPVVAVPAAALPEIVAAVPRKPGWVRRRPSPRSRGHRQRGDRRRVPGARLAGRACGGNRQPAAGRSLTGSAEVDRNASLARGFYVAAAVLVAAGGGLLWWDLQADAMVCRRTLKPENWHAPDPMLASTGSSREEERSCPGVRRSAS